MPDQIGRSDGRALPEISGYLAEVLADEWLWRSMGGEMILVTAHGGVRVVIAPNHPTRSSPSPCIVVPTERDGGAHVLRPIAPEHPIAKVLAAVPDMVRALSAKASAGDDAAINALAKAGLA